ncbi:MAG TPA: response regulator [Verrucomicrobiae bacterium]|jgi:DNA-binding NtrC family response regulator|nr:response regulator [Verrucomicrobiae bacterium]
MKDNSNATNNGRVRILHLEDSPTDAAMILEFLEDELDCAITHALNRSDFETALENEEFDIILCDNQLPGYSGFAALDFAKKRRPQLPIIILSGTLDEAQAVQCLKKGAIDYVFKDRLVRLVPAIRQALDEMERRQAQEHLFKLIVDDLNNALSPALSSAKLLESCDNDAAGRHKHVNVILSNIQKAASTAQQILSFAPGEFYGAPALQS